MDTEGGTGIWSSGRNSISKWSPAVQPSVTFEESKYFMGKTDKVYRQRCVQGSSV